jgi:hypothetical protein
MNSIKIDFEYTTEYGVFRDALHLPEDHNLTQEEINSQKEQRLQNWIAAVTTPVLEPDYSDWFSIPPAEVITNG